MYLEHIFKNTLENRNWEILFNGQLIYVTYVDDMDIIADLQHLMNKVREVSKEHGVELNVNKTKNMVIAKKPGIK